MSKAEKTIITNMCMIENDKGQILIQDRVSSSWPGVTSQAEKLKRMSLSWIQLSAKCLKKLD